MSNLLKSKPDDLTPQGSNPTTIVQKIIEICQSGSKSSRTGTELTSIKEHQNSVFTYKGNPATYVSGADGKFTFAVVDISGASPVMHTYTVDGMKNITQGEDVAFDSELPSVSSTDNGKVLKVVSGEWAKGEGFPKATSREQIIISNNDEEWEIKQSAIVNNEMNKPQDYVSDVYDDLIGVTPVFSGSNFYPEMTKHGYDIKFTAKADGEPYNTGVTYSNEKFEREQVGCRIASYISPVDAVTRVEARGFVNISGGIEYIQPITGMSEIFKVEADWIGIIPYSNLMAWAQAVGLTFPQDMPPAPDTNALAMMLSTPVNRESYHKAWIVYPYISGTTQSGKPYYDWGYVDASSYI